MWNQFFGDSLAEAGNFQILMRFIRLLATGSHPVWERGAIATVEAVRPLTVCPRPRGYEEESDDEEDRLLSFQNLT